MVLDSLWCCWLSVLNGWLVLMLVLCRLIRCRFVSGLSIVWFWLRIVDWWWLVLIW